MLGFGVLSIALLLGIRHAFDADHIAAIDNVTRQLIGRSDAGRNASRDRGRSAGAIGFFFAAGHSSVVFAMSVLTVAGVTFAKPLLADGSAGREALGLFGSCVSIGFLLVVGLMNLRMLVGLMRGSQKQAPGFLMRKTELVSQPWQMFFVGFLFGLGFDTATEIALLVLAATTAVSGASLWLALAVPLSFAVGMSFFDTLDSWLMGLAYRSALLEQDRERWYNLAFTGLSVVVALGVGLTELAGLIRGEDLVDSEQVGYAVVALFLTLWVTRLVFATRNRATTPG